MTATQQDISKEVRSMSWKDLQDLWSRFDLIGNSAIKGYYFENLIIRAFELGGSTVRYPYNVNYPSSGRAFEEIDGVVYVDHIPCLVESKCYADSNLNIIPIAKFKN